MVRFDWEYLIARRHFLCDEYPEFFRVFGRLSSCLFLVLVVGVVERWGEKEGGGERVRVRVKTLGGLGGGE